MAALNKAASKRWSTYKLFVTVILATIIFSGMLFCSTPAARAEEAFTGEKLAIILVIDTSGSMQDTDPQMLRETASRIFIDLLSPEDFLGIITFDHDARVVFPLERIESSSRKELIGEAFAELQPRGYTDYLRLWRRPANSFSNFKQREPGTPARWQCSLRMESRAPIPHSCKQSCIYGLLYGIPLELVEDYALSGIPIYTVAFSEEINRN